MFMGIFLRATVLKKKEAVCWRGGRGDRSKLTLMSGAVHGVWLGTVCVVELISDKTPFSEMKATSH